MSVSDPNTDAALHDAPPYLLVVDDEISNGQLIIRLFEGEGQVDYAPNGQLALEALSHNNYDVILLDVMMPGMNGFELLSAIRANPNTAETPVVMMSALSESQHIVRGLQQGANDYIGKPMNLHVVRARVRSQVKLKRLQDERNQTIKQLQRLNELREYFFRVASHDMKNPLSIMMMAYHEMTYYIQTDDPSAGVIMETMENALRDMQALIEDFMDVTLLQNNRLEVKLENVPLDEALPRVMNQFHLHAERKQINLVLESSDGVVRTDRGRLSQIFGNLLSNAIKYSPTETTVRVWTERDGDFWRILVADQGPGIPEAERDRLFTEFGKLTHRPTGGEGSSGLGLWITRALVQRLGGTVDVYCPPEGGSVFWLTLPAFDA